MWYCCVIQTQQTDRRTGGQTDSSKTLTENIKLEGGLLLDHLNLKWKLSKQFYSFNDKFICVCLYYFVFGCFMFFLSDILRNIPWILRYTVNKSNHICVTVSTTVFSVQSIHDIVQEFYSFITVHSPTKIFCYCVFMDKKHDVK